MGLGFIASYIKRTNTRAWGRARRVEKYRRLIRLVPCDSELMDIAVNTMGEDEPMAYAILRMRKQTSLQTVLEYYNKHDPVYSFRYGVGKNKNYNVIYRNTSGATTWTGVRALWAILNRIDKEHFSAAIQKTGEPQWIRTVGHERCRTLSFTPIEKAGSSGERKSYSSVISLYETKMDEA